MKKILLSIVLASAIANASTPNTATNSIKSDKLGVMFQILNQLSKPYYNIYKINKMITYTIKSNK